MVASSHPAGVGIRLGTLRGSYSRGVSPGGRNRTLQAWGGCSAQRGRTPAGWQPGAVALRLAHICATPVAWFAFPSTLQTVHEV